jgi:hypothetical protein
LLPWDDALLYMQRAAQDQSGAALLFLKAMYNVGYQKILAEFGRQVTERTQRLTLEAGQRSWVVPPDCLFPKTFELIDGTTIQPIMEVASDRTWAYMKSGNIQGRPTQYHYKPRFGVGGGIVEFYPIPSSAYVVSLAYEANDKNLSQAAYTLGSVSLEDGSAEVRGIGTVWSPAMANRYLVPLDGTADQMPYRIAFLTDTTHLTLEMEYNGGTAESEIAYKIVEIPNLPQDMQIMPCYFSLAEWWSSKGNSTKMTEFDMKFTRSMQIAKKTHSTVTRDAIVNPVMPTLPFAQYPSNYPTSIT